MSSEKEQKGDYKMYFSGMFRYVRKIILFLIITAMPFTTVDAVYAADTPETVDPAQIAQPVADPVDLFLSQSAFVGNSVGEGLTMYNNAKGKVPLGNAVMLTRVSYSFYADANGMSKFLPKLNGVPMRAKDAIKASGVSYVFISMGTNDLVGKSGAEKAFANYQQYLAGIMAENPFVTIFVESCTPSRPGSNVDNNKITAFNTYAQAYCDQFPNMFYVDIATPLKDGSGYLAANLSSDGSVHLTMKAYEIWANTVRAYISNFLVARLAALREQRAEEWKEYKANYAAAMKQVDEKKQKAFEARMLAKREAEAAEEAQKLNELLNVPDEVTLMHTFVAANAGTKYAGIKK